MTKRREQYRQKHYSAVGTGVGRGHGNTSGPMPEIAFDPARTSFLSSGIGVQSGTLAYTMGDCLILVSPPTGLCGWHMSISHPTRLPSWDEIAHARYTLIPNEVMMACLLPAREEYINLHNFCMQLHEIDLKHD